MNNPTRTDATKSSVTNTAQSRSDTPPHSRDDFFRDLKKASRRVKDRPSQPDSEKR